MGVLIPSLLVFLMAPFSIISQNPLPKINVKDYIYWTKLDIMEWHKYFPSRSVNQEQLTIQKAIDAVANLVDDTDTVASIKSSLAAMTRYQEQELQTAMVTMEGTSAQGCVNGISDYMERSIDNAVGLFSDCVANVDSSLRRINSSLTKTRTSYNTVYQTTLSAIDKCARTYPNRDSWSRLKACVEYWTNNYFTAANTTANGAFAGRAMGVFTNTVATCSQTAASTVVVRGWQFLAKLVQCSRLSENLNAEMYEKQLTSEFDKFITSNDLTTQISSSLTNNSLLVSEIERQMLYYYDLQKRALEKYIIEARGQSYYYNQMSSYLGHYLSTVSSMSSDHPANTKCISAASNALNDVLRTGAQKALQCDVKIVNNTKTLIAQVHDYFSQINDILVQTGSPSVLSCFAEGYIFAEQTISSCFSLAFQESKINIAELNATIVDNVRVLQGYEQSFFSNSSLPCGDSILSRAVLEADRALYNLQRCLYISEETREN